MTERPEPEPLPIDPVLPEVVRSLHACPRLVVSAPPGAGKTTRLPGALLDAGLIPGADQVVVLEPRRIAARMAASRVALERGAALGGEVGYTVRFEDRTSSATRIRYVTEGILVRWLERDPELRGVSAVVLDEFHERSLEADLALALLREAQDALRPDLRLVVMSATLDTDAVARYLRDCPIIRSEGRLHPVAVRHLDPPDTMPLGDRVASGISALREAGCDGSILVFLPGAREIRSCLQTLDAPARRHGYELAPLHGDLPIEEQERVIRPGAAPRIILSTNIAESSITVPGVVGVVDSGLQRVARFDPLRGFDALRTERVSRASAIQRSGRAGRLAPGVCVRLYAERTFDAFEAAGEPEILRRDLAECCLLTLGWGVADPRLLAWLTPPPAAPVARALALLSLLRAVEGDPPHLTELGRTLLRLPLHPRVGRVFTEVERSGGRGLAALLAALLSERDPRSGARARFGGDAAPSAAVAAKADLLVTLDLFRDAEEAGFTPRSLDHLGLDPRAARAVARVAKQLAGRARDRRSPTRAEEEAIVLEALLAGHPDRLVRMQEGNRGVMVGGNGVEIDPASVVRGAPYLLALDLRAGEGREGRRIVVHGAAAVDRDLLARRFPQELRQEDQVRFDAGAERVVAVRRTYFLDLLIEERETGRADPSLAAEALAAAAEAAPDRAIEWTRDLVNLVARVGSVLAWQPDLAALLPGAPGDDLRIRILRPALPALSAGKRSFAEMRSGSTRDLVEAFLPGEVRCAVNLLAPERLVLPSGRMARLEYRPGEAPILAARLQEFFGAEQAPAVCAGRVPVLLHLLAPNQRPLQVTSDLRSFWVNVYPKLRGQLRARYPRHAWPEDPNKT